MPTEQAAKQTNSSTKLHISQAWQPCTDKDSGMADSTHPKSALFLEHHAWPWVSHTNYNAVQMYK